MMLILVACLMGCGGTVSSGGEGGSDAAPAGGDGGGGTGGTCVCDCEPYTPSTHPLAYCEDPAHDGLACCQVDSGVCTGRVCQPAQ